MNFDQAFELLIGNEGGYSNNPSDPGGETMWGITARVAREQGYSGNMKDLPRGLAALMYRRLYWDAMQADKLPEGVRFDAFDGAVNSGVSQSTKWLQIACGAKPDGTIGPATLAAAVARESNLAGRYNGLRLAYMAGLVTWPTFGRGWANRIAGNLQRLE